MKVLVIGGTGTVGRRVVGGLLEQNVKVRCLSRTPEKAAALPHQVEGVVGDLDEPETLEAVMEGVEALFLLLATGPNETAQGLAALQAARFAEVPRVVYLSVPFPIGSTHIPHFKSKIPIEEALTAGEFEVTILRPNNFFQNDDWLQEPLMKFGVYPQPIGKIGMNRVDAGDIAEVAVRSLVTPGHGGEEYAIHGAEIITGTSCAELWSKHLKRPIDYIGNDIELWEEQSLQILPPEMVHDLKIMYDYFLLSGFLAEEGDVGKLTLLLGRPPRPFEEYVEKAANNWLS